MYIDVNVGGRRYGGYAEETFTVSVDRALRSRRGKPEQVQVEFRFPGGKQSSGRFKIGADVARWLAHALISASGGYTKHLPLRIDVNSDGIVCDETWGLEVKALPLTAPPADFKRLFDALNSNNIPFQIVGDASGYHTFVRRDQWDAAEDALRRDFNFADDGFITGKGE